MSKTTKPDSALDPFGLGPVLKELGMASGNMMEAWTKAWQATLTERAVPAMGMLNPSAWTAAGGRDFSEALEGWLGTPQWSDMVSLDSETLKRFAPATELMQLSNQYAIATARLCAEICQTFQARLAETGGETDSSGEALDLWNAVVDETLMKFNRSETFADLQRRYLRALMAWRLEQRWLTSRIAERLDLPTRDEVDELARRVHDLERENRRLRRAARPTAPSTDEGAEHG